MNLLVPIAMFGWIPAALALFAWLPPRRAVLVCYLLAWLFLPIAVYKAAGIPAYTKLSATSLAVFCAVLAFDTDRLLAFRPAWLDAPMAIWCLVPLASSQANGLGLYDGLSGAISHTIHWGLPYLVGRLYFTDLSSLRDLAIGVFVGGLLYVPLCLYEIRMSPQLHTMVYGWHQHSFEQTFRLGGWRPTVFMEHGLAVGMWMTAASLVGVWLWASGSLRHVRTWPMWMPVLALLITTVLCKSTGALVLLAVGLASLLAASRLRSSLVIVLLALLPAGYFLARTVGGWSAEPLLSLAAQVGPERHDSLATRLWNEDILTIKALERPWLGWGGWGRNRIYNEEAGDVSITDGQWILTLGLYGMVGLSSLGAALLLPPLLLVRRIPADLWNHPLAAPAVALSTVLILYSIDNIFNAMANPIFVLCAGGLSSLVSIPLPSRMQAVPHRLALLTAAGLAGPRTR